MAQVNFYLKDKNSKAPTLIMLYLSGAGKRYKVYTGVKCHPKDWSTKKQRIRSSFTGSPELNNVLDVQKSKVIVSYAEAKSEGIEINSKYLKEIINKKSEQEDEKQSTIEFFDFCTEFLETKKASIAHDTWRAYKTIINRLKAFETFTKYKVKFETINMDFYRKLEKYCYETKGYSVNTFGTTIKDIKSILHEATEKGINTNLAFKGKNFKKPSSPADDIYLTVEELDRIYNLDLSENPKLDKARDLFLVGCYTGLRFSDFTKLEAADFKKGMIHFSTQKNKQTIVVPMNNKVTAIRDKYDTQNQLPPSISNQKLNDYIKEVGKLSGINEPIRRSENRAGQQIKKTYKKYELIKTHTARRSFATNAYLAKVPVISVMKITGHTTQKSFMKYIKISQVENAEQLMEHVFFQ